MSRGLSGQCLASVYRTRRPRRSCIYSSNSISHCQSQSFATSRYDEESELGTQPSSLEGEAQVNPLPRWKATPPRMTAPFRSKPPTLHPNDFAVNEDPEQLDKVYVEVLGKRGDKILNEDVKWLAVTHKSFDHGRRGYNDRLAFLGMMALYAHADTSNGTRG